MWVNFYERTQPKISGFRFLAIKYKTSLKILGILKFRELYPFYDMYLESEENFYKIDYNSSKL